MPQFGSGGIDQHLAKGAKDFPHLRLFVREEVDRIHGVNGHSAVHLENQQLSIGGFTAIDADVLQFRPLSDGEQSIMMAAREVIVKGGEEPSLLGAFGRAFHHEIGRAHV